MSDLHDLNALPGTPDEPAPDKEVLARRNRDFWRKQVAKSLAVHALLFAATLTIDHLPALAPLKDDVFTYIALYGLLLLSYLPQQRLMHTFGNSTCSLSLWSDHLYAVLSAADFCLLVAILLWRIDLRHGLMYPHP